MIYAPGARAYAPDSLPTLQVVCNQQKRHSVDHTLLDVGLGDIAAQAEIESRQLSANASRSMGELIENVNTTFHKKVCPTVRADPKMVMQLVKRYKDDKEFNPPQLDSTKWGHRPPTIQTRTARSCWRARTCRWASPRPWR